MKTLMMKDNEVLKFDFEEYDFHVVNEKLLPYCLRDFLPINVEALTPREIGKYVGKIQEFFGDRTLSLSRDNAKEILNSIAFSQKLTSEERCRLSLLCDGVSVQDSYWVRHENDSRRFSDVNIRQRNLEEIVYTVSLFGRNVSLQHDLLAPDITTAGMFRKSWIREGRELFLYKSDRTDGFLNTMAECEVSRLLDCSNVDHVKYEMCRLGDLECCKCKCIANDRISLVDAEYMKQWCEHRGIAFLDFVNKNWEQDFAKMVVVDYVFANTDRHINNWGFLVSDESNEILGMAPLFDHNQAILALELGNNIDDLVYEPTGMTMLESAVKYFPISGIEFRHLPEKYKGRLDNLR